VALLLDTKLRSGLLPRGRFDPFPLLVRASLDTLFQEGMGTSRVLSDGKAALVVRSLTVVDLASGGMDDPFLVPLSAVATIPKSC
jgi:hypothetical protein